MSIFDDTLSLRKDGLTTLVLLVALVIRYAGAIQYEHRGQTRVIQIADAIVSPNMCPAAVLDFGYPSEVAFTGPDS